MSHELQHLPVFSFFIYFCADCQSLEPFLIRVCIYEVEKLHTQHCQELRAYSCAAATISAAPTKQWADTHKPLRLALHTKKPDTPCGLQSFWSLMLSVKQTVVTLLQTDSTHQKACDHLNCQQASAGTTTQSTVRLALKMSPQKTCHLHMFRTQCRVFAFYFC